MVRVAPVVLGILLASGCGTGKPVDGRYPGDASECDSLPLYERMECRDRHPPLHEPYDLRKPGLN